MEVRRLRKRERYKSEEGKEEGEFVIKGKSKKEDRLGKLGT